MKTFTIFSITCLISVGLMAQVGINTETPTTMLDVNGTVRVTSMPLATAAEAATFAGHSVGNVLTGSPGIGANLIINTDGELSTAPVSRAIGTFDMTDVPLDDPVGVEYYNVPLDINEDDPNEYTTFLFLIGVSVSSSIEGIAGGTHGRKITLYNSTGNNLKFTNDSLLTDPGNGFMTLANSKVSIGPNGMVEIVYDETQAGGVGRWIFLKFKG